MMMMSPTQHHHHDDDDTTTDSNTVTTKAIMSNGGTCIKHPHIQLRDRDNNGSVFQRDSCPECDQEFEHTRYQLMHRQRELDRQMQSLESLDPSKQQQLRLNNMPRTILETNNNNNSNNNNDPSFQHYPPPPPIPTCAESRPGAEVLQDELSGRNSARSSNNNTAAYTHFSYGGGGYGPPHPQQQQHHNYHHYYPPPPGAIPRGRGGPPPPSPYYDYYAPSHPHPPPPRPADNNNNGYLVTLLQQKEEELKGLRLKLEHAQLQLQEQSVEMALCKAKVDQQESNVMKERQIWQLEGDAKSAMHLRDERERLQQQHQQQHQQELRGLKQEHKQELQQQQERLQQRYDQQLKQLLEQQQKQQHEQHAAKRELQHQQQQQQMAAVLAPVVASSLSSSAPAAERMREGIAGRMVVTDRFFPPAVVKGPSNSRYNMSRTVHLLPSDGVHQGNDKLKSRCFVQRYDRDCNNKKFSSEPMVKRTVVGQFDEIVQFVKELIFDHCCEAYQKFKTCRYCGEKGKNPSCKMTFVRSSGEIPRVTLDLMSCSTYRSKHFETIKLYAWNGWMEDLIDVVVATGVQLHFQGISKISMTCQQYLGVQLAKSSSFHTLALKDTFFGPMLAILLKSSTTFHELELDITHKKNGLLEVFSNAVPGIAECLQSNRSLRRLRILAPTNAQDVDIAMLVQSLAGHPSLEKLDFGPYVRWRRTPCRDKTLQAICSVLESHCQVRSVNLSNSPLSFGEGAPHHVSLKDSVIAALSANQTLERLEIANVTNQEGPEILATFLIGCASARKLKYIDISDNRLDKDAMAALVDMIHEQSTLEEVRAKRLDLVSTDLGALIASLEENKTLKMLDLSYNKLGSTPLFTRLVSALTVNQTLESLILEKCDISDNSCNILAKKLPYLKGLKDLNLIENPFYNSGARCLLDGLKANVNLLSLQVGKRNPYRCHGGQWPYMDYREEYKNEYHQMQSLLRVNRFRSRVYASSRMPPNLWPLVLETAGNDPDVTYFMLREEILLHN